MDLWVESWIPRRCSSGLIIGFLTFTSTCSWGETQNTPEAQLQHTQTCTRTVYKTYNKHKLAFIQIHTHSELSRRVWTPLLVTSVTAGFSHVIRQESSQHPHLWNDNNTPSMAQISQYFHSHRGRQLNRSSFIVATWGPNVDQHVMKEETDTDVKQEEKTADNNTEVTENPNWGAAAVEANRADGNDH